ncbi:MAG TPA: NmrA family NAD(P)-binding protein [Polyangiaceae bacterium]|nr:NmrA family NAD(P)-binding protein [Polyangiaceae bacterium]
MTTRDLDGRTVLVVGASGTQGGAVARSLAQAGAIVRGASKRGAHTRAGLPVKLDLMSHAAIATEILRGVDAAFLHVPLSFGAPGDTAKVLPLVDELGKSVRRVVFSASGPLPDSPVGAPFVDERLALARAVLATGKGVVLQTTGFLENFSAAWSAPSVVAGELVYPFAPSALGRWVTNRDVGAAVVGALSREEAVGRIFMVAGPELLSMSDVAARIGDGIGRAVQFRRIEGREYGQCLAPFLGQDLGAMIGGFYDAMPNGNPSFAADGAGAARALGYAQTTVLHWARTETWCP